MQTLDASTIIDDAQRLLGRDLDQLETRQKQEARTAFSLALQEVWETWWWEALMQSVQAAGAMVYAADTAFAADDFCYFPATQKFYQAMQATTGNAPATYDSGTASYVTNYAYWAEALAEPTAGDYVSGSIYAPGDLVRNPTDGYVYQRVGNNLLLSGTTAFVSESELKLSAVGSYVVSDLAGGSTTASGDAYEGITYGPYQPLLRFNPDAGLWVFSDLLYWRVYGTSPSLLGTYSRDYQTEDVTPGTFSYQPAGSPADEPTLWHALVAFTPAIVTSAKVRAVGTNDLRNSANAGQVDFEETLDGIRIPGWTSGVPWLWQRRPTPVLTGDDFDAAVEYAAMPAADLTFS